MSRNEEHVRKIIAKALETFSSHKATYKELGGVDTLEFRRPGEICYSLRVVFDHERGRSVYICGDIGEAVIYPTCPATLKDMAACFTRRKADGTISVNWGYFLEKVRCSSDRYDWSEEDFGADFKEECEERGIENAEEFIEEHMNSWDGGIEVDGRNGVKFSERARREMEDYDHDFWEWAYDCGKRVSGRVILWLVALRLASEMIERAK